ncbi:MAG TPA: glycosyltransferase N-terminal domain-containing protein [Bacteroidia bacterium]|nr:glycosyltransferase N-terminal domain-containing protein [Bacteroidia bacterium]
MWFYNLGIFFIGLAIKLSSIKKAKAKLWVGGRKNWRTNLTAKISKLTGKKTIWVHCSSYGEFEQGRPVIEALRKQHPTHKIVLSFFSPSGYEAFKNWNGADVICYLPLDTKQNAKDFIEIIKPDIAIFIKYEFWLNFLFQLKEETVPTFLISAVFKPHQPFFKWYGGIFKKALSAYKLLLLQDENSGKLLETIQVKNYKVVGDTRFDRVFDILNAKKDLPLIDSFCVNNKILVVGSSWPKDEEIVIDAFKKLKENHTRLKLIIAPHEVNKESVAGIEKLLDGINYTLYTNPQNIESTDVLVIDTIGVLSQLYRYATATYIGGGFNDGIHNILESLVYNVPVAFGLNHYKFVEATETLQLGISKEISNKNDLFLFFDKIMADENYQSHLSNEIKNYMQSKSGATQKIVLELNSVLV